MPTAERNAPSLALMLNGSELLVEERFVVRDHLAVLAAGGNLREWIRLATQRHSKVSRRPLHGHERRLCCLVRLTVLQEPFLHPQALLVRCLHVLRSYQSLGVLLRQPSQDPLRLFRLFCTRDHHQTAE